MEPDLARKLYEGPPPGQRELYMNLFRTYVELRPQEEVRGYVAKWLSGGDYIRAKRRGVLPLCATRPRRGSNRRAAGRTRRWRRSLRALPAGAARWAAFESSRRPRRPARRSEQRRVGT